MAGFENHTFWKSGPMLLPHTKVPSTNTELPETSSSKSLSCCDILEEQHIFMGIPKL